MENQGRHLFVYGTLMPGAAGALGHAQRARLMRESRCLGPATMTGARLYDLGRYPGLVETGDPGDVAHGEAVALVNPSRTLSWLDAYEDIVPGDPNRSDYARLERSVRLEAGDMLSAWVYVFLGDVSRRRLIPAGRW